MRARTLLSASTALLSPAKIRRHSVLGFVGIFVGSVFMGAGALAKQPPLNLTCTEASLGAAVKEIVPEILPGSISPGVPGTTALPFVQIVPSAPALPANPPRQPTPIPVTPAYCQVSFVYLPGGQGPNNPGPGAEEPGIPYPAYNVGQVQQIQIQINLPLNSNDGGTGGKNGNWNGDYMGAAAPGNSGRLATTNFPEGINSDNATYGIRLGYVTQQTDTGQTAAAAANSGATNFAITPPTSSIPNKIAYGSVADWIYRGSHYGKQWADQISKAYYGKQPKYHYWNSCSGGGNEGMAQLQHYGDEYDGFLIGAPAYRWQQFRLADSWPALVMRKLVQTNGQAALLTPAQQTNLNAAVVAKCDVEGDDTVPDGVIADPRLCTLNFTAQSQVCGVAGAPAAPACITTDQAAAVDRVWDGPRNSKGARLWYPYDISIPFGGGGLGGLSATSVALTSSTVQVVQWDHANAKWDANNCLFVDQQSLVLGTANISALGIAACGSGGPGTPITYEQEQSLGSNGINGQFPAIDDYTDNQNPVLHKALRNGTKIIHTHGTADGAIRWRQDVDYYNRVATWYAGGTETEDYRKLRKWYRFFPMPGVGHCSVTLGGGPGGSASDPFLALRDWVEKGKKPRSLLGVSNVSAFKRPLCPFPKTAIYNGTGDINDPNSYQCGGDLQTQAVVCNDVKTIYKQELTANLDYDGVGLDKRDCKNLLPPPHVGMASKP